MPHNASDTIYVTVWVTFEDKEDLIVDVPVYCYSWDNDERDPTLHDYDYGCYIEEDWNAPEWWNVTFADIAKRRAMDIFNDSI